MLNFSDGVGTLKSIVSLTSFFLISHASSMHAWGQLCLTDSMKLSTGGKCIWVSSRSLWASSCTAKRLVSLVSRADGNSIADTADCWLTTRCFQQQIPEVTLDTWLSAWNSMMSKRLAATWRQQPSILETKMVYKIRMHIYLQTWSIWQVYMNPCEIWKSKTLFSWISAM